MARPTPRRPTARACALLWLMAALLLLKAAVPLAASVAAQERGITLAEVCSVYGVRTVALPAMDGDPQPAPAPGLHDGELHCPLGSLMASAALAAPPAALVVQWVWRVAAPASPPAAAPLADASRRWLAWRLHAPPAQA